MYDRKVMVVFFSDRNIKFAAVDREVTDV